MAAVNTGVSIWEMTSTSVNAAATTSSKEMENTVNVSSHAHAIFDLGFYCSHIVMVM